MRGRLGRELKPMLHQRYSKAEDIITLVGWYEPNTYYRESSIWLSLSIEQCLQLQINGPLRKFLLVWFWVSNKCMLQANSCLFVLECKIWSLERGTFISQNFDSQCLSIYIVHSTRNLKDGCPIPFILT